MFLRQSTSQVIRFGPFLDSTDGVTPETGLTIAQADMQLSKDGGAFAQKNSAGNATHDVDGWYSTTLNATDTATAGELKIQINVVGALPVWEKWFVLTATAYDALQTGTFNNLGGTAQTADHTAAIADIPTVSEFNARTILSASYALESSLQTVDTNVDAILVDTNDLQTNQGDWLTATGFNTVVPPSVAQFNARTLLAADYFDPSVDAVANVTLCATTTTNTDMVGTNNALLAASYTAPDNAGIAQIQVDISALNDISVAQIFAGGDVDGFSLEESLKLIAASSAGVLAGAATTTITIKAIDGSKTRLTATVDGDGNRSVVIKDATG